MCQGGTSLEMNSAWSRPLRASYFCSRYILKKMAELGRINIKMVQPDFHENGIDLRKIRDLWVSKKIADLGVEHSIFLDSSKNHLEFPKSWVPKSPWLFLKF